mgnify:CR=1 FL=1
MTELEMALKQRQEKFVETRTIIASEVTKFLNSLSALPDEIKAQAIMPTGTTAQEILPALWSDPFNQEEYEAQLSNFNRSVDSVTSICDALNEEAMKCLRLQS